MTNLDKYFNVVIQKSKQERGIQEMKPLSEPIGRETIGRDTPWWINILFFYIVTLAIPISVLLIVLIM